MPEFGSIGHLISLSIQSERALEIIYRSLSEQFQAVEEVAAFWSSYADEEVGHIRWLEGLRSRTGEDRMALPADQDVLRQAERSLSTPIDMLLSHVTDLQDAFELANELEHSETNLVFEFLIGSFAQEEDSAAFLRAQLHEHVQRLESGFPPAYRDPASRRGVTGKSAEQ